MPKEIRLQDYPLASHSAPRSAAAAQIPARLRKMLSLDDFEIAARRHLPAPIFAYVSGGCETNRSLDANRSAFAVGAVRRRGGGTNPPPLKLL